MPTLYELTIKCYEILVDDAINSGERQELDDIGIELAQRNFTVQFGGIEIQEFFLYRDWRLTGEQHQVLADLLVASERLDIGLFVQGIVTIEGEHKIVVKRGDAIEFLVWDGHCWKLQHTRGLRPIEFLLREQDGGL